nr:MAG TPA: hypothetical protein [Caudoviricetes sp.]
MSAYGNDSKDNVYFYMKEFLENGKTIYRR